MAEMIILKLLMTQDSSVNVGTVTVVSDVRRDDPAQKVSPALGIAFVEVQGVLGSFVIIPVK